MSELIEAFTDGACRGNPGPGGWGVLLRFNGHEKRMHGGEAETTNNRMELMAVIKALESLKKQCKVKVTSDSQYVLKGINEWRIGRKEAGKLLLRSPSKMLISGNASTKHAKIIMLNGYGLRDTVDMLKMKLLMS